MRSSTSTKESNKYVMLVVSLKGKFVRKRRQVNPDYPNLRIVVKKYDKELEKALDGASTKQQKKILNLKKRFRGIVTSEGICLYKNKVDAYKAAYNKFDSLLKEKRKVRMHSDSATNDYSVYCIRLTSNVWQDNKIFRKSNTHVDGLELKTRNSSINAYYVGQTGQDILVRYKQHRGQDPKLSTDWGKKYFIKSFEDAYGAILIQEFEKETGKSTTNLPYGKSLIIEQELTDWIRKKGMGAYCA